MRRQGTRTCWGSCDRKGANLSNQQRPWQEFDVGGVSIEFMAHGSGATVLLVHAGVFSDWFRFVGESDALRDFRVVRIRRAGYGRSQPARHLTLADHARHAAALAQWLCPGEQVHWVGHSSSCQIGLSLAIEEPTLVSSLVLLEPAAAGEFQVPASAALGAFFGDAMAAFQKGDIATAFDKFMRGVCGEDYRAIIEKRLGTSGVNKAIRESSYFFRDEVGAMREFQFGPEEAARVRQPVLCIEGGSQPAHLREMSGQISRRTVELFPQANVVIIPHVNHALPLQDPDAVARAIASFIHGRSSPG
jgi:pimeloyl-ACP methyl ester carboxylesterase